MMKMFQTPGMTNTVEHTFFLLPVQELDDNWTLRKCQNS